MEINKLELRRSDIDLFYKCPYAFYRKIFKNIESSTNNSIEYGIDYHKQMDELLKKGEIPNDLIPFFNDIGEALNYKNEITFREKEEDNKIILHGTFDLLLFQNDVPKYIVDYKTTKKISSVYYYKSSLIQPNVYSYLLFKEYPKLDFIEFQYWFPVCEKKTTLKFVINKEEANNFVNSYKEDILDCIEKDMFIPHITANCSSCLYKCEAVFKNNIVLNDDYMEKEKDNIYTLLSRLNSTEYAIENIEKIKNYRKKLKTIYREIKTLDSIFDSRLKQVLPDEYFKIRKTRYLKKNIWKWLLNKGVKIDEIFKRYVSRIPISYIKKDFKDIPAHYIKEEESKVLNLEEGGSK